MSRRGSSTSGWAAARCSSRRSTTRCRSSTARRWRTATSAPWASRTWRSPSSTTGSGSLLDGLDEALTGMSAGDAASFAAELAGGDHAGEQADVSLTVHSVKVKELPELDDEFAQSASEYDTLGEFRAGTRGRLEGVKRLAQVGQARDRALEAVLARLDIPLPDRLVASEVEGRQRSLDEQLERSG